MFEKQRTVLREGRLEGIGLHTGALSSVTLKPAAIGSGVSFFKEGRLVSRLADLMIPEPATSRCSAVGEGKDQILTVEHLLSALEGTGVSNVTVDVVGPEIPGLDGSARPFVDFIHSLGLSAQDRERPVYAVTEPIFCQQKNSALAVYPSEEFSITYTLDYDHPRLKAQTVRFTMDPELYAAQIAPARTFCTEKEAKTLREEGLGLGATPENTLVVMDDGSHEAAQRLSFECARHKVLDLIGDLGLLGFSIKGRIVGVRSGHALNRSLARAIQQQRKGQK